MEAESPEKVRPEDKPDSEGYFPMRKMLKLSQEKKPFDLKVKNVKVIQGEAYKGDAIHTMAKGGGDLVVAIGGMLWNLKIVFDDLELAELEKRIIISG